MSIGLTIQAIKGFTPSQLTSILKILGINHIEYDPSIFFDLEDLKECANMIKHQSIVIHAPYFSDWSFDLSSKLQSEKVDDFLNNLNAYGDVLKIHSVVVHPPKDPNADAQFFQKTLNSIQQKVLLENLPGQTWEEFSKWYFDIKKTSSSTIQMCFDIPHSLLTHGKDKIYDIPEELLKEITYIHISDLNGSEDSHWPFFTEGGQLSLKEVQKFLRKLQFVEHINMEMRPVTKKDMVNIVKSYLYLEKITRPFHFLLKLLRICLVSPFILVKLKTSS